MRLFSSLGLVVAPPACEPGADTPAIFGSTSTPLSARAAAAFDGAFTRCHGSRLLTLRLLFTHRPAVSFLTSPAFGRFSQDLPGPRVLPGACAPFVHASGVCSDKGINSHINEMEFKFLIETIFIGYKPIKLFIPLPLTLQATVTHGGSAPFRA